jgi:predicted transcriptional regulator
MKELTKAEEQIMHVLWELGNAFVKDVIRSLPDPKPAYNTVSTIVRILEKKRFVDHDVFGKTHRYFPLVSKEAYTKLFMRRFVKRYFGNSYPEMVSFFARDRNLTVGELEEIKAMISKEIQKQKGEHDG